MIHRDEIDGLRAIAVGTVVLCHAGLPFLSGGFVGVDVFFVISGFLITSQLKQQRGRSIGAVLIDFYARRARRILPSLALVTLVTLAASSYWLLPDEQQGVAVSAIAAALFASNIYFWQAANDYFAPISELQPLLHTWSLGVEEQFYIGWPLLLFGLWWLERTCRIAAGRAVLIGISVLVAASFVLSAVAVFYAPGATFFLTPFRLWELGAGALLAIHLDDAKPTLPPVFGIVGLAAIGLATVTYTSTTPFPGAAAALPALGAVLVIAARPTGLAGRLLTWRPVRLTGTISYAWYLWHWPLLAIVRTVHVGERDLVRDLLIVCIAYVPAYLSTRYIETPIRRRGLAIVGTDARSLVSGAALIALVFVGAVGLIGQGQDEFIKLVPASRECMQPWTTDQQRRSEPCVLSRGNGGSVFLLGDSQANHWSPVLAAWARKSDRYATDLSYTSCNVLAAAYAVDAGTYPSDCRDRAVGVPRQIEAAVAAGKPVGVVVSVRWSHASHLHEPTRERDMNEALRAMERLGVRVLILGVTPNFEHAVPSCVARRDPQTCKLERSKHDAVRRPVDEMFARTLRDRAGVRYWDPAPVYCDGAWCHPTRQGTLLFFDHNHLTPAGAGLAQTELDPQFDWLADRRN